MVTCTLNVPPLALENVFQHHHQLLLPLAVILVHVEDVINPLIIVQLAQPINIILAQEDLV